MNRKFYSFDNFIGEIFMIRFKINIIMKNFKKYIIFLLITVFIFSLIFWVDIMNPIQAKESKSAFSEKVLAMQEQLINSNVKYYTIIFFIALFLYTLLYFAGNISEKKKKQIVDRLISWAKKGSKLKKYLSLALIFIFLTYYHSIGKQRKKSKIK